MKRLKYFVYFLKNAWFVLLYKFFRKKKSCERFVGKKNITTNYGDEVLLDYIKSNKPFMAVRYGAVELSCINNFEKIRLGLKKNYKDIVKMSMKNNAGFFPPTDEYLNRYSKLMNEIMKNTDILGISGIHMEDYFYKLQCSDAKIIQYFSFEPIGKKWLSGLNGKKVLVISPFKEEIEEQIKRKEHLDDLKDIDASFKVIRAVQSIGDEVPDYSTWFDALDHMKSEISKIDFDIALVGAGAYGTPLCAYIKSLNKQAIQTGGATSLLFGIIGSRWEKRDYVKNKINEFWIRPSSKPKGYEKVEKGCYW
ncbi:MAG: hypothetical protein J1F32_02730 [Erysipelotrichales bacterium]|nr:hypothetical protein [Erysipelotrichales bacterium]